MNGNRQEIPSSELLKSHFNTVSIDSKYEFEGLANRNSLSYIDTYGLAPLETMDTMFRGTLRYKGFSDLMYAFYKLGLLETDRSNVYHNSWPDFFDYILFNSSLEKKPVMESRIYRLEELLGLPKNHHMMEKVIDALTKLSLLQDEHTTTTNLVQPPKIGSLSPLDTFCILLQDKLKYNPGEKDMLVLYHEFEIKLKNGNKTIRTSSLISEGIYGSSEAYTAMAKTVGLPVAIATEMIARVLAPTLPNIYNPILKKLDEEGIKIKESTIQKGMREKLEWKGSGIWNQSISPIFNTLH
ncbi:4678_t:CDS:2, partial [Scutellospora calospora]